MSLQRILPIQTNVSSLTILAIIAALGAVVRLTVRITVIPEWVELTPGFLFSELGGIIGGIPGGILVGAIVGLSGAFAGGEVPILPMIGNIFLGVGTGYAIHLTRKRDAWKYWVLVIFGGAVIGGFFPTMTIFASVTESFEISVLYALIDGAQAAFWAFVALVIEKKIVRPIAGVYLYHNVETESVSADTQEDCV